jgi:hypothetical protein
MTNRVKALEQDVVKLDEAEFRLFSKWFADYQDRVWERQIRKDGAAGKLDFLRDEAAAERGAGTLEPERMTQHTETYARRSAEP